MGTGMSSTAVLECGCLQSMWHRCRAASKPSCRAQHAAAPLANSPLPPSLPLLVQARTQELRRYADMVLQQPDLGCCRDCVRVQLRVVASLRANAAWYEEWVQISTLRLQALEQGQPYPPLTLPYLDVRPYLAEGVPEDLPPSIDRCSACQEELEEVGVRRLARLCRFWDAWGRSSWGAQHALAATAPCRHCLRPGTATSGPEHRPPLRPQHLYLERCVLVEVDADP